VATATVAATANRRTPAINPTSCAAYRLSDCNPTVASRASAFASGDPGAAVYMTRLRSLP
jgi:hypothetical protein